MIRRHYFWLLIGLFAVTTAGALAEPSFEELEQRRRQVVALRKQPEQIAKLRENLKSYLDLPEKRREVIVKLDQELRELPAKKQERYYNVLERYADWLETLRVQDPQAYQAIKAAPDAAVRLALIKDRRDREWMNQQPKAQREQWAILQGAARAEYVVKLRQEDRQKHEQWVIAKRFWRELESKQALPCRLSDYSAKVKDYVTEYLLPTLSDAEKKQLESAEGRWPDYPQALVEIASKRPSALPPEPPRKFAQLPVTVQHRLIDTKKGTGVKTKLHKEILQYEGPGFASKVVSIGLRENKLPFANEYLAPNYKSLLAPMQSFVESKLLPAMDQAEKRKLSDSEGKWPDYPLTIQELAQKHDLSPPWHFLPEPDRWKWDLYRKSKGRSWGAEVAKEKKTP
jgi:hypothetical protein